VALLLAVTAPAVELSPGHLVSSVGRLAEFLGHFLAVPDWSYAGTVLAKLFETIEMAFLGTAIAVVLSLPIGLLAARNSAPHASVSHALRALLTVMRSLPEMMWALVFVSAVGLGPLPGVAALAFVTVGYLGKFLAEAIEAVPDAAVEGVAVHGANRMQLRFYALMPQAWPDFIAVVFYVFEHNVRAATVLGLVGAGGIGYDMIMAMRLFRYDRLILCADG
jgi:phosphonate transport system permease protein